MKRKNILQVVVFCILTLTLILMVSSRNVERKDNDIGAFNDGQTADFVPDNDTTIIAHESVTPTPVPTPRPTLYKPDVDVSSWEYMLVNGEHNVGAYTPPYVVNIDDTAQLFDERAVGALEEFLQAARDAGFTPYINTAYRPYSTQEYIFNGKASQIAWGGEYTYEQAVEMAKSIVAVPGTSEHQSGLACDIADKSYSALKAEEMDQELMTWLRENCAQYGFILRYPSNKVSITGWDEPWHFRYVGKEAAEFIMENKLCLEEFLELYQ